MHKKNKIISFQILNHIDYNSKQLKDHPITKLSTWVYLYQTQVRLHTTFKQHFYYLKDLKLDLKMSVMSNQIQTRIFQETDRINKNGAAQYLILQVY